MKIRYPACGHIVILLIITAAFLSACGPGGSEPAGVTGLQASGADGAVTLTWTDPADADLDRVEVTWTPEDPESPVTVAPAAQSVTVTGLTNGTSYAFTVTAVAADGEFSEGVSVTAVPGAAGDYYVSTEGDDGHPGTAAQPWKTIQKAADTVPAGSTVTVRGGTYNEQVTVRVSGSAAAGPVTFRSAEGETVVLDGTGLSVPDDDSGLFLIVDRSYIVIRGFEIRNYRSAEPDIVPVGIHIRGASRHIEIRDNRIHRIESNAAVGRDLSGADAHGIAVFGTGAPASLNSVTIDGNELYDLKLGSSEALVLNGNVENFTVTNNTIHDVDNIAIDIIGFEETSPDPDYDQARSGLIRNNTIYRASSFGNPAYGEEYSADGIYVDGGRDIVVEMNTVYDCDIGVEVASEHRGRSTSAITVRNNFLYGNTLKGISMGGYDRLRGSTENCLIVNNTLFNNDTRQDGSGEIGLTFDTRNNTIKNNIFYANGQGLFIGNNYIENSGNVVDYNLYFSPAGRAGSEWEWKDQDYTSFEDYQAATGNDAHSLFADPQFIDTGGPDLHLGPASPALDAGDAVTEAGDEDIDGQPRVQGDGMDLGADERGDAG